MFVKFAYNYIVVQVSPTFTYYICPKKISNFSLEHLFSFCTCQSTARTTIAAIVRYRAIIRNIEWSKYKREVRAKGWLYPPSSTPPALILPCVSRRSSFCRGIIGLYEPDKNTRQRQKSHTSQGLYMHSRICTCVSLHIRASFSFCFPFPWLLWSCQCPAISMGEFCRRLIEINGSLWKVKERERKREICRNWSKSPQLSPLWELSSLNTAGDNFFRLNYYLLLLTCYKKPSPFARED